MPSPRNSIVVTGASRGIGRAVAEHFVRSGWTVFAGVRSAEDGERLVRALGPSLRPLALDVTRSDQIESACKQVEAESGSLAALVNNAGILVAAPLEAIELDDVRSQFEVNVFGTLAVTQAFLPLLRQRGGRIVNVGSVLGMVAPPFLNPYSASKFALAAITDGLRRELRTTNIRISLIEAGAIDTEIWGTSFEGTDRRFAGVPTGVRELYEQAYHRGRVRLATLSRHTSPVSRVVGAVSDAVESSNPKPRYRVGRASTALRVLSHWPDRALDRALRILLNLPGRGPHDS